METNTELHRGLGYRLTLHKSSLEGVVTSVEAGDLEHRALTYHSASSFILI